MPMFGSGLMVGEASSRSSAAIDDNAAPMHKCLGCVGSWQGNNQRTTDWLGASRFGRPTGTRQPNAMTLKDKTYAASLCPHER